MDGFIEDYDLDPDQIVSVRSFQTEIVQKADKYLRSVKPDLTRVKETIDEARRQRDTKAIEVLNTKQQKLMEPIQAYLDKLQTRCTNQLRREQIERYRRRTGATEQPAGAKSDQGTSSESSHKTDKQHRKG